MSNNQLEIFNAFGSTEITCFSCDKILPQKTEKVAEKHFCTSCLEAYTKTIKVSHTVIPANQSTK